MIQIDGSYGEGGGQILRSSLSLSALTGRPFRIFNLRAGRRKGGLRPQHLLSCRAAARICRGRLEGAVIGSREVAFSPGRIESADYSFDVSEETASAGSVSLVLQALLWPLLAAGKEFTLRLKGGTHVAWSPVAEYVRDVFLPTLVPLGIDASLFITRRGFYPIGGGALRLEVAAVPFPLHPLRIESRGELVSLRILSQVANLPLEIAERQLKQAQKRLAAGGLKAHGEVQSVEAPGKGTSCFLLAEFERVRAGFSSLGAIGKRAEVVADEAADDFFTYLGSEGALDPHQADQIVPGLALASGQSSVTVSRVTDHLRTNLWVVGHFLPVKHKLTALGKGGAFLEVSGEGFVPRDGG